MAIHWTISSLEIITMRDRFFEIFETDNPLAVKYLEGGKPITEGLIKTYPINN